MKKVNNYFSHDFNARNDIKLKKVNMQLGLEGIGLYWCIIESLYENNGYLSLDDDIDLLSYELRIDKKIIINLIENFDLFKKNQKKFYSPSVLDRLKKINTRANQNRENVLKRWEKNKKNRNRKNNEIEIPQKYENDTTVSNSNYYIKEKKKKENKRKEIINTTTTTINNNLYSFIEENFGKLLSPIEKEKIDLWLSETKEEIIREAILIAVMNGKLTLAYVDGILKNWKKREFETLEDVRKDSLGGLVNKKDQQLLDDLENYNWLEDSEND